MISKEIHERLNKQINVELTSAYYYLALSIEARRKIVMGVYNWFLVQAREKLDHSRILQNYLFMQNAKIKLLPINALEGEWDSVLTMFEDAYNHERIVTETIHEIAEQAQGENDYATQNVLRWFIRRQMEVEKSCDEIVLQYRKAGNDQCVQYQIDNALKLRRYERPHILYGENWIA